MLIKTIKLLFKNNASETEKDFQGLNDTLDDTADANEKVNKSFDVGKTFAEVYGDEARTLGDKLGQTTDRLYELAIAGDTASDEYKALVAEAGRLRQAQVETDLAIDGASQTFSQKLGPALNGVTSGFAVAQGAMALFGSENKALEESLLKVQAALAIQQGVEGLQQSYKQLGVATKIASATQAVFSAVVGTTSGALKVFRLALISTGIGAIVVGLGLLIANFDKVTKAIEPVIQGLKDFGDAIGLTNFAEEEQAEERQKRFEQEKKRIEELKRAQQVAFDIRQKQFDLEIRKAKLLGKETIEIEKQKIQASIEFQKQKAKELELVLKESEDFINAQIKGTSKTSNLIRAIQKGRQQQVKELKELNIDIADSELTLKDLIINNNKEKADSYKQYRDTRLNIARQIEDLENELLEEGKEKELEINQDKFRRLREDAKRNTELTRKERAKLIELYDKQELAQQKVINQKYIDLEKEKNAKIDEEKAKANQERIEKEDALFELELSLMKDRQMAEIIALTQQYDKKFELANGNAELERQLTEQQQKDIAAIEDKYRKEKEAKDKESRDKTKAEEQALQDYKVNVVQGGLSAINDIAQLFAKGNERQQKRAFQIQKAVGIAQATINTAQAITKVFAETTDFTPTQSLRIANAVAIGVAGAAQIASIASQQFQGGGDVETPEEITQITPEFNVVGESGVNQLAQLQQQPVQAYVVSGEVTTSQALDRNRVENATL